MLSHILYGTVSYSQGGLLLTAQAAGERAVEAFYDFQFGGVAPVVTIENVGLGAGTVHVVTPATTTEGALASALRATPGFKLLFHIDATGDPFAQIAAPSVRVGPVGGILQHLIARLGLNQWGDRELLTTGAPEGMIWPANGHLVRSYPDVSDKDEWEGELFIALALQQDASFAAQNCLLDYFRRKLGYALKVYEHPDLISLGLMKFEYANALKDEATGTALEQARLRVVYSLPVQWTEPAFDDEDITDATLQQAGIGINLEPLDDPLGPGGGEVLDALLVMDDQGEFVVTHP